jgi:hypothetical protein
MTDTREVATEVAAVETAAPGRGVRSWIVAVIGVVALAIGVLIGNSLDGGRDTSDPERVINQYNTSWEENDPEALLAVVTDDFVEEYRYYSQLSNDQVMMSEDSWDARSAARYAEFEDYRIELSGDAIVVGDGPWFVSVNESQEGGGTEYEGTAVYVVVDDGETLKLVSKSWVGTRQIVGD